MSVTSAAEGSVVVSVSVNHPADVAWRALADPESLRMWLGNATESMTVSEPVRIDFGDGDFFVVQPRHVDPPRLVEFDWRFLGVGPLCHIRWEVRPTVGGCEVTVVDHADHRDRDAVQELTDGWRDFLGRLRRYLDTGRSARYPWRSQIDGAIDLRPGSRGLLEEPRLADWLPVAADEQGNRWFFILDDELPRRFEVTDWRSGDGAVRFSVLISGGEHPTSCVVWAREAGQGSGTRLSFEHSGWRELGLDSELAGSLRARFAATWIAALDMAGHAFGVAARSGVR